MLPILDLRTEDGQRIVVRMDAMVKEAEGVAVDVVVAELDGAIVVGVDVGELVFPSSALPICSET